MLHRKDGEQFRTSQTDSPSLAHVRFPLRDSVSFRKAAYLPSRSRPLHFLHGRIGKLDVHARLADSLKARFAECVPAAWGRALLIDQKENLSGDHIAVDFKRGPIRRLGRSSCVGEVYWIVVAKPLGCACIDANVKSFVVHEDEVAKCCCETIADGKGKVGFVGMAEVPSWLDANTNDGLGTTWVSKGATK